MASSNITSLMPSPSKLLSQITVSAISRIWDKTPNQFQLRVIPHILAMSHRNNDCQGVLVVQATGGGKSMVYQCSATIMTGVTLVIQNTLSLYCLTRHQK